ACSGGATLRATAARGGASLGGLSTGTQVQIIGRDKEWCHVRANGRDGYIYSALVDTTGKMAPNPPEMTVASSAPASSSGSHKHHHNHHEGVLVADASHEATTHSEAAATSTHSSSSSSSSHSSHHHKHSKSSAAPVEAPGMVP